MISAENFLTPARARGFDFFTGVPCSFLTPLINRTIAAAGSNYMGAVVEGEAVAIAAGAWLAGRRTVVMCQNSGLGNCVNPLTSLNHPFRIPTLLVTTWRGQPGLKDEPQHEVMGRITQNLLDTIEIEWMPFPQTDAEIVSALDRAESVMNETGLPFAMIMAKGSVEDEELIQPPAPPLPVGTENRLLTGTRLPTRLAVLERFLADIPDTAAVIASTGKSGRELFTLDDREQHLYQVGSMGCASAMGLGVALNTDRLVAVLDGDGAALMRMGALATIGAYHPKNLVHIILDNCGHDSTGGQATVSSSVDFARVALACGYRHASICDNIAGFSTALADAAKSDGPHMIHMKITGGSMTSLGRPTVKPVDVARRFKAFLASS